MALVRSFKKIPFLGKVKKNLLLEFNKKIPFSRHQPSFIRIFGASYSSKEYLSYELKEQGTLKSLWLGINYRVVEGTASDGELRKIYQDFLIEYPKPITSFSRSKVYSYFMFPTILVIVYSFFLWLWSSFIRTVNKIHMNRSSH